MASANFNGLVTIYGERVTDDIATCEFHFQQSMLEVSRKIGEEEKQDRFKELCMTMLKASTIPAYQSAHRDLQVFIGEGEQTHWLSWWHARRKNIFRAFNGQNKPRMNQGEVVNASHKNRGQTGMTLRETAEFDTADSLTLKERIACLEQVKQVR